MAEIAAAASAARGEESIGHVRDVIWTLGGAASRELEPAMVLICMMSTSKGGDLDRDGAEAGDKTLYT